MMKDKDFEKNKEWDRKICMNHLQMFYEDLLENKKNSNYGKIVEKMLEFFKKFDII